MIERKKLPFSTHTNSLRSYTIKLKADIKSYEALTTQMEIYKSHIFAKKISLTTTDKGDVLDLIGEANRACNSIIQADQALCTKAKSVACNTIKNAFTPNVLEYNKLLPHYTEDADYKQFRAYDITGLETLTTEGIIGKDNLDSIDCVLT